MVRYSDVVKFLREYCILYILEQKVKRNDRNSDFQEYVRDRHPRYDYPIIGCGDDGEMASEYAALQTKYN